MSVLSKSNTARGNLVRKETAWEFLLYFLAFCPEICRKLIAAIQFGGHSGRWNQICNCWPRFIEQKKWTGNHTKKKKKQWGTGKGTMTFTRVYLLISKRQIMGKKREIYSWVNKDLYRQSPLRTYQQTPSHSAQFFPQWFKLSGKLTTRGLAKRVTVPMNRYFLRKEQILIKTHK